MIGREKDEGFEEINLPTGEPVEAVIVGNEDHISAEIRALMQSTRDGVGGFFEQRVNSTNNLGLNIEVSRPDSLTFEEKFKMGLERFERDLEIVSKAERMAWDKVAEDNGLSPFELISLRIENPSLLAELGIEVLHFTHAAEMEYHEENRTGAPSGVPQSLIGN